METINQNVNEEKLHDFFEQYSMPFIQNMAEQGLNMTEIAVQLQSYF